MSKNKGRPNTHLQKTFSKRYNNIDVVDISHLFNLTLTKQEIVQKQTNKQIIEYSHTYIRKFSCGNHIAPYWNRLTKNVKQKQNIDFQEFYWQGKCKHQSHSMILMIETSIPEYTVTMHTSELKPETKWDIWELQDLQVVPIKWTELTWCFPLW